MAPIRIEPLSGTGGSSSMSFSLSNVPAFPEATFGACFPEAIGDAAAATWFGDEVEINWEERDGGVLHCVGRRPGELSYTVTLTPGEEMVEAHLSLTNETTRDWETTLAFNCFNPNNAEAVWDHDCLRHWVGQQGQMKRLMALPRQFGPRPTIQLYSVEGAPLGKKIPFVANFAATLEDVVLEGWMAIQSVDGRRFIATASKPALFLFQNMEYSCIHSAPSFGPLAPGATGQAITRLYFVEGDLAVWHERMK